MKKTELKKTELKRVELKKEKELEKVVGGYSASIDFSATSTITLNGENPTAIADALLNQAPGFSMHESALRQFLSGWANEHSQSSFVSFRFNPVTGEFTNVTFS